MVPHSLQHSSTARSTARATAPSAAVIGGLACGAAAGCGEPREQALRRSIFGCFAGAPAARRTIASPCLARSARANGAVPRVVVDPSPGREAERECLAQTRPCARSHRWGSLEAQRAPNDRRTSTDSSLATLRREALPCGDSRSTVRPVPAEQLSDSGVLSPRRRLSGPSSTGGAACDLRRSRCSRPRCARASSLADATLCSPPSRKASS